MVNASLYAYIKFNILYMLMFCIYILLEILIFDKHGELELCLLCKLKDQRKDLSWMHKCMIIAESLFTVTEHLYLFIYFNCFY